MNPILPIIATATVFGAAQTALAGRVDLVIDGFANDAGLARIVLMKDESGYRGKGDAARVASVPIRNGRAKWLAEDVPAGTYAIIAHHDTNSNNLLDRPVFGLPVEPYGYSKGAWTSLGLPDWASVAFAVGERPVQQAVHLRMNAFAVFGQIALIGGASLALIVAALALFKRFRRHRPDR